MTMMESGMCFRRWPSDLFPISFYILSAHKHSNIVHQRWVELFNNTQWALLIVLNNDYHDLIMIIMLWNVEFQILDAYYVVFSVAVNCTLIGVFGIVILLLACALIFIVGTTRRKSTLWLIWCLALVASNTNTFHTIILVSISFKQWSRIRFL